MEPDGPRRTPTDPFTHKRKFWNYNIFWFESVGYDSGTTRQFHILRLGTTRVRLRLGRFLPLILEFRCFAHSRIGVKLPWNSVVFHTNSTQTSLSFGASNFTDIGVWAKSRYPRGDQFVRKEAFRFSRIGWIAKQNLRFALSGKKKEYQKKALKSPRLFSLSLKKVKRLRSGTITTYGRHMGSMFWCLLT